MDKKRLIIAIVVVIVEIILMALVLRYFLLPKDSNDISESNTEDFDSISLTGDDSTLKESNNNEGNEKVDENVMKVTINNETYTMKVDNLELMEELFNSLPEKFSMTELNGNEKYYYLNSNMKNANSEAVGQVQKGDVMLFGSDCLVIFYDSFETEFRYTKIGHIDNLGDIGSSNVEVSITK